jgi:hypothetical protein
MGRKNKFKITLEALDSDKMVKISDLESGKVVQNQRGYYSVEVCSEDGEIPLSYDSSQLTSALFDAASIAGCNGTIGRGITPHRIEVHYNVVETSLENNSSQPQHPLLDEEGSNEPQDDNIEPPGPEQDIPF